jgi:hypothetical protein
MGIRNAVIYGALALVICVLSESRGWGQCPETGCGIAGVTAKDISQYQEQKSMERKLGDGAPPYPGSCDKDFAAPEAKLDCAKRYCIKEKSDRDQKKTTKYSPFCRLLEDVAKEKDRKEKEKKEAEKKKKDEEEKQKKDKKGGATDPNQATRNSTLPTGDEDARFKDVNVEQIQYDGKSHKGHDSSVKERKPE